jgi:hypothetical protein
MTSNELTYLKLEEDRRANRAKEGENYRHNLATEGLESGKLGLEGQKLAESARHNQAVELETYRSDRAQENLSGIANSIKSFEADTNRYNADTKRYEADIKEGEYEERQRHNQIGEQLEAAGTIGNVLTSLVRAFIA